jgi:cytochrome c oxidase accessory protein FixG
VLHDGDSIVIGYDAHRGEPRAPIRRPALRVVGPQDVLGAGSDSAGACIDCKKCVWACPTGIDIRNGFQMECIACAQCIDVCDEVMVKVGRPRGLIRYAAQNTFEGRPTRVLRPRLIIYAALAALAIAAFAASVTLRAPFEANVLRPVGVPWVIEGDGVRNQIDVHLVNKSPETHHYRLAVEGPPQLEARFDRTLLTLPSLGDVRVPVLLIGQLSHPLAGQPLTLVVRELESGHEARTALRFLSPR